MISKIYAILLHLYPRRFQAEFGEEMQSIFKEILKAQSGHQPTFFLLLHELHDLPGNLLNAYASERPQGWEAIMKKRIIYFFGLVILFLGVWLSASMYMDLLNPGTIIALAIVVVLIAISASPVFRRVSYKIWVSIGFISLVVLFTPTFDFMKILIISFSLIITALLIISSMQVSKKRRGSSVGKADRLQEQPKIPTIESIIIPILSVLLMAKAFHSFYWFMIWDSTTDSLDWLWLPIPVLAVIFSSVLLYFLLPDRNKSKGFFYLVVIPALVGVYNLAEQVDFRQLTNKRAEHVSQLVESYHSNLGHYPISLKDLTPQYALSIPDPVIIFGQD